MLARAREILALDALGREVNVAFGLHPGSCFGDDGAVDAGRGEAGFGNY